MNFDRRREFDRRGDFERRRDFDGRGDFERRGDFDGRSNFTRRGDFNVCLSSNVYCLAPRFHTSQKFSA